MSQTQQTKHCKHCQTEINKKAKVCPNCKRKQGGSLKFIIIAFFAIGIIGAIASQGNKDSDTATNAPASGSKETGKEDKTITFGEAATSDDLSLKINEVGESTEIKENDFLSYTPDSGKYAIVNITLKNIGKESLSLTSGYFKLISPDGAEYNPTILIGLDNKYITFESINPGLDVTGNLVFEVPSDMNVQDATLKFTGLGLFTGATSFYLK